MGHLSHFVIDRMVAGLAGEAEAAEAAAHSAGCPECRARITEAERDRDAFLARNPPVARAEALRQRRHRRWRWPAWALLPALATAGLLLIVRDPRPDVLSKGGPHISVQAHRGARTWEAHSGDGFIAGDALQIDVDPQQHPSVAVLALDAGGRTRPILAHQMAQAGPLPSSLVLDAELRPELLVVVFSLQPIAAERIAEWGRNAAAGGLEKVDPQAKSLGSDVVIRTFLVRKVPSPSAPDVIPGRSVQ